ncbi:hypothetical protein ACFRH6_03260 [Streptomyces sp. NPDC056749]|uniref:hypothetical protein n=1 Tax=Streptomyces sp. NPDC056749 TaxID=3345936 RepID=UPI00368A0184
MPTLLYYPLVKPPKEVLHQALLYWDDIASVVPEDPAVYEGAVSTELKELKDRGLYHPVVVADRFTSPLQDHYQCAPLVAALRELAAGTSGSQVCVMDSFLFRSKVGYVLENAIVDLGLGRRLGASAATWGRSLAVSREVQLLLVGALAQEMACTTTARSYTPYTDQPSAYETFLRPSRPGGGLGAWRVELGRLLPTPAPDTPTSAVLAFREKHAAERERLMAATQTMLSNLRRDWEHPADVLRALQRELTQSREDYESAVRSSRMAWVSRSVSVTVGVATAAVGALVVPDLSWVAGIAGSVGFNIATREIRPVMRARRGHPFSYLHHVERELV